MKGILVLLILFASFGAKADPLNTRIRFEIPDSIATRCQLAAYSLQAIDYHLFDRSVAGGDMRSFCAEAHGLHSRPGALVSIRDILHLIAIGDSTVLTDHNARSIAFASKSDALERFTSIDVLIPSTETSAVASSAPVVASTTTLETTGLTAADSSVAEIEPIGSLTLDPVELTVAETVIVAPEAKASFEILAGETLKTSLERWCEKEGVTLQYEANFSIPIIKDREFTASNFGDAVTELLTPLSTTRFALIARRRGSVLTVKAMP